MLPRHLSRRCCRDLRGKAQTAEVKQAHAGDPTCLAMFPDRSKPIFASGSHDGTVKLWDLRMNGLLAEFTQPDIFPLQGPQMGVSSVEFSLSGRLMFVAYYDAHDHSQPSHLLAWDILRGQPHSVVKTNVSCLPHRIVTSCAAAGLGLPASPATHPVGVYTHAWRQQHTGGGELFFDPPSRRAHGSCCCCCARRRRCLQREQRRIVSLKRSRCGNMVFGCSWDNDVHGWGL